MMKDNLLRFMAVFVPLVGSVLLAAAPVPVEPIASVQPGDVDGKSYDLVVIGSTPGAIACAVRAAREGLTVLLVNHTRHLGGFITRSLLKYLRHAVHTSYSCSYSSSVSEAGSQEV